MTLSELHIDRVYDTPSGKYENGQRNGEWTIVTHLPTRSQVRIYGETSGFREIEQALAMMELILDGRPSQCCNPSLFALP